MRLYGHDIDETRTALEAGLGWIVGWEKSAFVGADALRAQKAAGVQQKMVGFELTDPGIARPGHDVYASEPKISKIGVVTSGTQTPFLKKSIGLAYVPTEQASPGTEIAIDIRGRMARARIVSLPFYKRTKDSEGKR
jgi:aminomethyltransferase